jgi:DNA polymerase I|tara:strand:+ start:3662 stop:4636 length:975 start_codon:yes stop_codon:yes gene_type:complete
MKKQERVMLIDALNLFLRAYIVNPTIAKDGSPIGGTVGFLKSLQKLTREIKPTRIIICWDGRGGSRKRKQQNANYKAGRSPVRLNRSFKILTEVEEKENKIVQMYKIMEYLNNFPTIQLVADEVEADDIISYVCRYSQFKDYQKVIVSSDKDFYQLLDDTTVLHRPIQQKYLNCKNIVEEHGIHPNNFALARAMAGDKSDNLKGVPGVGLKTIAKRFPFFADKEDVTIKYLIEFCNHQESNIKAYAAISDDEQLVKDNYSLMQLYSPSLSIQTKQSIDWTIKEFQYMFNNTETNLMMYQDGINQINWSDMFREFKRLRMDNKKR